MNLVQCNLPPVVNRGKWETNWSFLGDKPFAYQNLGWDFALENLHPEVAEFIRDICPVNRGWRDYRTVTVKWRFHNAGEHTCLPGWHTDCTTDLQHRTRPEVHHIWCSSEGTEFIATKMLIQPGSLEDQRRQIEAQPYEVFKAEPGFWVTYSRFNFHRGPVVEKDGWRLLIRVTETDLIQPRNRL